MIQSVLYKGKNFDKKVKLRNISNTEDNRDIGYFLEVDSKIPAVIKENTKHFPFCRANKFSPQDKFSDYMNKMRMNNYTPCRKLTSAWSDKKSYLIHYRLLRMVGLLENIMI